jgi:hypothetical protein
MRQRLWPFGRMTTTPFDRSALGNLQPAAYAEITDPGMQRNGRFRYAGAPRPVPLRHRAIKALN